MNRPFFSLMIFLCSSLIVHSQGAPKNVLFLGNSYTGSHNLPQVFKNFSDFGGYASVVSANHPGGTTLNAHTTNSNSINLIQQGGWDYVVLQEQSQIPSWPIEDVEALCFPFAAMLDSAINEHSTCAETVFFMTWGRENGDAMNCGYFPPVCTYEGMDSLLHERYMMLGDTNDAIVSPVGAVWHYIRDNYPYIDLYAADGSHPSQAGTYAAACTFYAVIHEADPAAVPFDWILAPDTAAMIRNAASMVAYNQLSNWYVGAYDTMETASFSWDTAGLTVDFNLEAQGYTDVLWLFGDGQYSLDTNPSHSYDTAGVYLTQLQVTFCDTFISVFDSIVVGVSLDSIPGDTAINDTTVNDTLIGILETANREVTLFPNPAQNQVIVKADDAFTSVKLIALDGRVIFVSGNVSFPLTLDLLSVESGVYYLVVEGRETRLVKPLVVQQEGAR